MEKPSEEALVMEARLLAPEVRAARIVALEAELVRLRLPPFVEYPKMLPDGRVVNNAEEEASAAHPMPEPDPETEHESRRRKKVDH
jgi:hypothetical protein